MMRFFLYIDPGTGSMLFSLFIGLATAAVFAGRALILKIKFVFSGGKSKTEEKGRQKFVIYSDHKRYWNVFKPVCDEFEKRGIDIVYFTQSADDPVFSFCENQNGYKHVKAEFIGEGNKGFARLNMLKADIVLSTTPGLGVLQWKRSRDVKWYVHIPHSVDELGNYRMFSLDFYDALLATGKNQERTFRSLEKIRLESGLVNEKKKEIVIAGCTYFDSVKKRIENSSRAKNENITVLVAPSWGKSSLLNLYGENLLSALKNTDFDIIVRPHPQSYTAEKELLEKLKNEFPEDSHFSWNNDNDNFDVLNKADIMITDFSGIIFDFTLLFNKPLIYTKPENFNYAPYENSWLNDESWTFKVLPKLGIELQDNMISELKSVIENAIASEVLLNGREEVKSECCAEDGKSAANVVDYLVRKQKTLSAISD